MKLSLACILLFPQICFAQIIVQPSSKTICSGNNAQFVITVSSNSNFQWQDSSSSGWINLSNNSTINGVNNDTLSFVNTSNSYNGKKIRCIVDTNNSVYDTSITVSLNVLSNISKPVISSNQTICYNTQADTLIIFQFPTGANGVFTYQWQVSTDGISWSNINGFTGDSLVTGNLTQSTYYRLNSTSTFGCGTISSDSIKITVYNQLVEASISASQNICYNARPDTVKITTPPSGGNGQFTYQWQASANGISWSNINGFTGDSLIAGNLTQTTFYRLNSTSTFGCGIASSDSIKIAVYNQVLPASISAHQTICHNARPDTIKMTTFPSGGNGQFTYQWQASANGISWSNINGFTGDSLVTGNLTQTTFYRLNSSSTFGCGIISSDSVKITVYNQIVAASIGANQNICYNTSPDIVKIITFPSGGNSQFTYQWQFSNDSAIFLNLIGENKDSLIIGNLTSLKYYSLISSSVCGNSVSNPIRIDVYPSLVRSDINYNNTNVISCYNSKQDTLRFNTLPTGGNGIFTHQWQSASNGIDFFDITGANDVHHLPNNLLSSTYYRVLSTSSASCGFVISDTLLVFVYPNIQKPNISGNQSICFNTLTDTIKMTQLASGANGQFTYQWQSSSNGLSWINVAGFIGDSLLTGLLTSSRYYRIQATSTFGCGTTLSDSVFVNVYPQLVAANIGNNQSVCYNFSPVNLKSVSQPSGGGSSYSYQWQHSDDSIAFNNLISQNSDSIILGNLTFTKYYKLVTTSNLGCGSDSSNMVKINVYKPFNVGSINGNDTICYNFNPDSIIIDVPPAGGDNSYTYQWLSGTDTLNWSQITGANSDFLFISNLRSSSYYKTIMTTGSGCGFDTTNWIYVKVNPLPDSALINGPTDVCRNQRDLAYKREARNTNYNYCWSSLLGNIQYGVNLDSCFLFWGLVSGIDSLKLIQTNPITGCTNTMILPVQIKDSESPNRTSIIRKPNSNILICEDQQNGIKYQWGYIQKLSGIATDIIGATLQYVQLPFAFDTTKHIYFVRTSLNTCPTNSYFEYNPIPLGLAIPNTEINYSLYPNPIHNVFTISGNENVIQNLEIVIISTIGKEYKVESIGGNQFRIEQESDIVPGTYVVLMKQNGMRYLKKIIIE